MEDDHEVCDTGLGLGLGVGEYAPVPRRDKQKDRQPVVCFDLSFELCPKEETVNVDLKADGSSFNNNKNSGRKKLRLTKEQSTLLEDSFKLHSTLNPTQKQALAEQLTLKPRQVEVWFQNRRARTKLKQTEVDCELLKKCCKSLSDENQRLKKQVQELRLLKEGPSPLYIQLPKAAALTMCPSCEKVTEASSSSDGENAAAVVVVQKSNKLKSGFDGTN